MKNVVITESVVLSSMKCPRRGWMDLNKDHSEPTSFEVFLSDEAIKVRAAAYASFDLPIHKIKFTEWDVTCIDTMGAVNEKSPLIIGGVVKFHDVYVRLGCMRYADNGYEIIVVTSKARATSGSLELAKIRYAAAVFAGVNVTDVFVMHLDTASNSSSDLFVMRRIDVNDLGDLGEFTEAIHSASWTLLDETQSVAVHGDHCENGGCPHKKQCFADTPVVAVDSIHLLPSQAGPIKKAISKGITSILSLDSGALKHKRNALVYHGVRRKKGVVTSDLRRTLAALPYPRFFIDFETCAFPVPRHAGMRPYQPLPFQWSMHIQSDAGSGYEHREFLDLSVADPRFDFLVSLLANLGDEGPVFVFSSFEETRLKELADLLPDLKDGIHRVIDRIVDVCPLARQGYYHPEMRAKWGLKSISPTLPDCPDLTSYAEMDVVADGMAAQAAYSMCISGQLGDEEFNCLKSKMSEYCKADTRGLAHFVEMLEKSDLISEVVL